MSVVVLIYFVSLFKTSKRLPIIFELLAIAVYGGVVIIFLFPQILDIFEEVLGVQSAINFIMYFSVFIAYFMIFLLYKDKEEHRQEITKLTREIAYLKNGQKGKKD